MDIDPAALGMPVTALVRIRPGPGQLPTVATDAGARASCGRAPARSTVPSPRWARSRTYEAQHCSAARALEAVGERWSLLIIRDALFRDITRFSEFQRSLGIAPNILAGRLDGFVAAGVMTTRPNPDRPGQHDYVLTEKGRDVAPVIVALTAWGDRWDAPDGPPIVFTHNDCGGDVHLQLSCETCRDITTSTVTTRPGPNRQA
jgi:DNA-binding HxlR family transcriptional regulator